MGSERFLCFKVIVGFGAGLVIGFRVADLGNGLQLGVVGKTRLLEGEFPSVEVGSRGVESG